jgi:hypothetical protein
MATTDPINKFNALTDRQKQVLGMFCKGSSHKEIGKKLFISENTVKTHMGNIYKNLDLIELEPQKRKATIFEVYSPILKKSPSAPVIVEKEEELEPVSPEVERMVEEDENAFVHLNSSKDNEEDAVRNPPNRRSGCTWALIGIILGAGLIAVLFFSLGGNIPGFNIPGMPLEPTEELISPTEPPAASPTPVVIVVTATPLPASETPLPTDTPSPTLIPTDEPTSTPTTPPSPTLEPTPTSPILEIGEWHIEDDVWVRLAKYEIDGGLINFDCGFR